MSIYGHKLYLRSGRQFQVFEHYELNPIWREVVEQGRYWSPRLLLRFAPCVVLAGLVWFLPVYLKLYLTWLERPYVEPLIAGARIFCWVLLAAVVSGFLVVLAVNLESIVVHARLMRPGLASGQVRYSAEFGYARARLRMFAFAGVCSLLAVLQPTPVTIGFALGPLMSCVKSLLQKGLPWSPPVLGGSVFRRPDR